MHGRGEAQREVQVLHAARDDPTAVVQRERDRVALGALDDALLATYGTAYVDLHGNAHRVAALRTRLDRLRADAP